MLVGKQENTKLLGRNRIIFKWILREQDKKCGYDPCDQWLDSANTVRKITILYVVVAESLTVLA
jgi:hypothetical protein